MCFFCHTKLLAAAMVQQQIATCPVCRVDGVFVRDLVAESILAELLTECPACNLEVKRGDLSQHQVINCCERYDDCNI